MTGTGGAESSQLGSAQLGQRVRRRQLYRPREKWPGPPIRAGVAQTAFQLGARPECGSSARLDRSGRKKGGNKFEKFQILSSCKFRLANALRPFVPQIYMAT